jgi:NADH-quinone oxidoreductase subunit N
MTLSIQDLITVGPEFFVLGMTCLVLLVDVYIQGTRRDISYWLAQLTLAGALVLTLAHYGEASQVIFHGQFVSDPLSTVLKAFIYVVVATVFLYSRPYLKARGLFKGEYYVLGLFAVLGMMIMVSARSFLTIYLGLELLSLSLYAMVAFDRDSRLASEAAMKYFVLGAIASGMLLYGMSIVYGVSGHLDLAGVSDHLLRHGARDLALVFALSFIVVGLAFKLGAVPFHMWLPDVYHGAPTSVTLFVGTAPKIAAFAMLIRLLAEGLDGLVSDWQQMLEILALLSIGIGNVVAIAQTNLKRMLAYSTISHVGFLILGVISGTQEGYAAAMFYTLVYSIMAAGGFGMIIFLSRKGFEAEDLDDFKGMNQRSPWYAFIMLLLMFSMAGVPPTAGFYAKLTVIQAVIRVDMVWLAVYAVVFSVIGAFYYLRVVKLMYFDVPQDNTPLEGQWDTGLTLSANGLLMLVLGVFPGALMGLCTAAFTL